MQKWEYFVAPLLPHNPGEILNTFGQDGWELVGVLQQQTPAGGRVAGGLPEAARGLTLRERAQPPLNRLQRSAPGRSSTSSSGCSIPTDSRTRVGGTSSGDPATLAWVILPGCSMRDSTPPRDSARKNSSVRPHTSRASSSVSVSKETIPPKPRICRPASSWPGWPGRPG